MEPMEPREIVDILSNEIREQIGEYFNDREQRIFLELWREPRPSYEEIAKELYLTSNHTQMLGRRIFTDKLTPAFRKNGTITEDEEFRLSNFKSLIEQFLRRLNSPSNVPEIYEPDVERPDIEGRCLRELAKPGGLLRIKGARGMGKTHLLSKISRLYQKENSKCKYVAFNFNEIDGHTFSDAEGYRFSHSFCEGISTRLNLEDQWNTYYKNIGWIPVTRNYFEQYLLPSFNPLFLALEEVDRVFKQPTIAKDFCNMLKAWNQNVNNSELWKCLRLVVVHSTDVYASLDLNYSPLHGIGEAICLQPLNQEEVQDMARQLEVMLDSHIIDHFIDMTGGSPLLVKKALKAVKDECRKIELILNTASTFTGIYRDHLQGLYDIIKDHPELCSILKAVTTSPQPISIKEKDYNHVFQLESLGLIKVDGNTNKVEPFCKLYQLYFSNFLN